MKKHIKENWPAALLFLLFSLFVLYEISKRNPINNEMVTASKPVLWEHPNLYTDNVTVGEKRKMIIYGKDLIANTAAYLGPKGSVARISNGMNCQNCHLDAGSRDWGNNYGAVSSTYPKMRGRSGMVEDIPKRVNDCLERSLNGKALNPQSHEMLSIVAYMNWLGQDVKKGVKPEGTGIEDLPYLDRPASPEKGSLVYVQTCQRCHGVNGEGIKNPGDVTYQYPPLWGDNSYNNGAGLYRISRFAGFVKNNMPFDQATYRHPVLSDEQAWDVAAYVNSQPHPVLQTSGDYPDLTKKPVDSPQGPYADSFNEQQHKYGPFKPIEQERKNNKAAKGHSASGSL